MPENYVKLVMTDKDGLFENVLNSEDCQGKSLGCLPEGYEVIQMTQQGETAKNH